MKYLLILLLAIGLLSSSFYFGYNYHSDELEQFRDTIIVRDTNTYIIFDHSPWYHLVLDTVEYNDTIPFTIDTAQVIKEYFAKYSYTRNWKDSLMDITLHDVVTQNRFDKSTLNYKILRPQTIINNTVVTSTPFNIYIGLDIPLNNKNDLNIEGIYIKNKRYIGAFYSPISKTIGLKIGIGIK